MLTMEDIKLYAMSFWRARGQAPGSLAYIDETEVIRHYKLRLSGDAVTHQKMMHYISEAPNNENLLSFLVKVRLTS